MRGIWRRTILDEYLKDSPAWDVVLDLDALAKAEGENWVWQGADFLQPDAPPAAWSRCRAAAATPPWCASSTPWPRRFVEGGFALPEAKSQAYLEGRGHALGGHRLRPRLADRLGLPAPGQAVARGTPLASAVTVFEGEQTDVSVSGYTDRDARRARYDIINRTPEFFRGQTYLGWTVAWSGSTSPRTPSSRASSRTRCWSRCAPTGPSADAPSRRTHCWPSTSTTSWPATASSRMLFTPGRARLAGRRQHHAQPPAAVHAGQREQPPLPPDAGPKASGRREEIAAAGPRHRRPRRHQRRRRHVLLQLQRLPDAVEPVPGASRARRRRRVKTMPALLRRRPA